MKKVIGIGLGKTGTNSLLRYLAQFGYTNTFHDNTAANKAIAKEGLGALDKIVREHDAMSDAPFPYYMEHLMRTFPDAYFIYTYKDRDVWFESVKEHKKRRGQKPEVPQRDRMIFDSALTKLPKLQKKYGVKLLLLNLDGDEPLGETVSKFMGFDTWYPYPHINIRGWSEGRK